jgi:hypothetical protein
MTRFELALGLLVAAFVPVLAALPADTIAGSALFAPLLELSSSAVFAGCVLFVAALPRADASPSVAVDAARAAADVLCFAPLGAWCASRDGAWLDVALALALAALAAAARARSRPSVWRVVWWTTCGVPPLAWVAFGRAGDDFALAERLLAPSPFQLVQSASGAAPHAWWGSAVFASAALVAAFFAPRRAEEAAR